MYRNTMDESIKFHTNVSQLVRRVLPVSYSPHVLCLLGFRVALISEGIFFSQFPPPQKMDCPHKKRKKKGLTSDLTRGWRLTWPTLWDRFHYPTPTDIDRPLNETVSNKIRDYRTDYDNVPVTLFPSWLLLLIPLTVSTVSLCTLRSDRFLLLQEFIFTIQPVPLPSFGVWINLNIDGVPIDSRSHTHPSHSQTSRLSTSSLSLGVPVLRATDPSVLSFGLTLHRHPYICIP